MGKSSDQKNRKPIEISPNAQGEVPTITSLLGRKKMSKKKAPDAEPPLEPSKPIDLSSMTGTDTKGPQTHPSISTSNDVWATRGIAREHRGGGGNFRSPLAPDADEAHPPARPPETVLELEKNPGAPREVSLKLKSEPQLVLEHVSAPPAPQSPAPRAPQGSGSASTVQVASRRAKREDAKPPVVWTNEMLKKGSDPLGKGLALLMERGARGALFLAIAPPVPGGKLPQFISAAATKLSRDQIALWTGLRWDPAAFPQVWNQILKSGYIELQPPGAVTNIGSGRNTIRAAFGIGREEILLLIRIGPISACRGVLVVFSERSLIMELTPILTLFNTPLPQGKAA